MLLTPLQSRRLFEHALANGYAVLAVNADSHAAVTDVLEAAREADAPVIIEASLWQLTGRSYGAGDGVLGLARYLADLALLANDEAFAGVPVVFHTDHIKGPDTVRILGAGIRGVPFVHDDARVLLHPSTISLDASDFTERENIETICRLAEIADEAGVPVTLEMEAEVDEGVTPDEVTERLIGEVEQRHPGAVHLYAPGLGTKHGLHDDYPEFKAEIVARNVDLLERITGRRFGIALHGSSGMTTDDLSASAAAGVVKVNWSSESLLIRSTAAAQYYAESADALKKGHPKWKETAMDNGVQAFVSTAYIPKVLARIETLNGRGQASRFMKELG